MLNLEEFRGHVDAWMQAIGLPDWRYDVVYEGDNNSSHKVAWVRIDSVARVATFSLNTSYRQPSGYALPTPDVERYALHEVLHVLLASIGDAAARERSSMHDSVVEAEHAAINRLLRLLRPIGAAAT